MKFVVSKELDSNFYTLHREDIDKHLVLEMFNSLYDKGYIKDGDFVYKIRFKNDRYKSNLFEWQPYINVQMNVDIINVDYKYFKAYNSDQVDLSWNVSKEDKLTNFEVKVIKYIRKLQMWGEYWKFWLEKKLE